MKSFINKNICTTEKKKFIWGMNIKENFHSFTMKCIKLKVEFFFLLKKKKISKNICLNSFMEIYENSIKIT